MITSKSGTIGGWTIGTKQLNSGKDNAYQDQGKWVSTYVGLSSDEANAYAFWCGSSNAANAPFRVRRNGLVYLLKVVDLDENGNEKVVDLGKYSLGKLQYSTVVSVGSDGTVKLSNGKTFDTAASVKISGAWSGTTYTALAKSGSGIQVDKKEIKVKLDYVVDATFGGTTFGVGVFPDGVTPTGSSALARKSMGLYEDESAKEVSVKEGSYVKARISTTKTYNSGSASVGLSVTWTNNNLTVKTTNRKKADGTANDDTRSWNFFATVDSWPSAISRTSTATIRARIASTSGTTIATGSVSATGPWDAGKSSGYTEGKRDYQPSTISQNTSTKKITVKNAAGDSIGTYSVSDMWTAGETSGKSTGWSAARGKCVSPSAGSGTSFTVKWPGVNYNTQGSMTFTLSKSGDYVVCKWGGSVLAKCKYT